MPDSSERDMGNGDSSNLKYSFRVLSLFGRIDILWNSASGSICFFVLCTTIEFETVASGKWQHYIRSLQLNISKENIVNIGHYRASNIKGLMAIYFTIATTPVKMDTIWSKVMKGECVSRYVTNFWTSAQYPLSDTFTSFSFFWFSHILHNITHSLDAVAIFTLPDNTHAKKNILRLGKYFYFR